MFVGNVMSVQYARVHKCKVSLKYSLICGIQVIKKVQGRYPDVPWSKVYGIFFYNACAYIYTVYHATYSAVRCFITFLTCVGQESYIHFYIYSSFQLHIIKFLYVLYTYKLSPFTYILFLTSINL